MYIKTLKIVLTMYFQNFQYSYLQIAALSMRISFLPLFMYNSKYIFICIYIHQF